MRAEQGKIWKKLGIIVKDVKGTDEEIWTNASVGFGFYLALASLLNNKHCHKL